MELIEMYIEAVINELPEKDRHEVAMELRNLISELLEDAPKNISEQQQVEMVLTKLGNPSAMADQYRGKERYLIGPKYYRQYITVLKIVLGAVFLGITIAVFVSNIMQIRDVTNVFVDYFADLTSALFQGAAWVTVIFAIMEYNQVDLNDNKGWTVKDLKTVVHKRAKISRGEAVFAIIFATIFFSVLFFVPEITGVYYSSNSAMIKIPLFDAAVINSHKAALVVIYAVTIAQEGLKLLWGSWKINRALIYSLFSLVSGVLTAWFLTSLGIFNSKIVQAVLDSTGFSLSNINRGIVIIIMGLTFLEIVTVIYRAVRYGNK